MKFIKEEYNNTLEIKKSKFIAYIVPYSKFTTKMQLLKQKYPKARHFVYAYRYLNTYEQIVENSSDDGEPNGTSGKPCLSVLAGAELINCAVIVVRFSGGIKLGTGGLVKAYSDAVNSVLQLAIINEYIKLVSKLLRVEYSLLSQVEYMIKKFDINIVQKNFNKDILFTLEGSVETFTQLEKELFRECTLEDLQRDDS